MIAGPDAIDGLIEDSGAARNVHGLASMCPKTHEDIVDSPERPIAERARVLDHFIFNDRACWSKGMSRIIRIRASPSIAIAYADVAQGLAAGPKAYAGSLWVRVEISNQHHLLRNALNLFLDEASRHHGLEFALALKIQLEMGKMVDEQEGPDRVWCLYFHDQGSRGEPCATRRHV
jgi:hypothetical protein